MQRFYGDEPCIIEKRRAGGTKRNVKSRRKRKTGFKIAVAASILSVFALFYVAFNSVKTESVVRVKSKEWYFVGIFTTADSGQASIKALDIRTRGGAGFIYNDGNYSVIASVYPTEREANAVAEKQPDPATVIKIGFDEIKFLSEGLSDPISSALAFPYTAVTKLNTIAQSYEKGNLTESEVEYRVGLIGEEAGELSIAVEGQDTTAATYAGKLLAVISDAVNKSGEDESAVLSSRLRFCACEIVDGVARLSSVYADMQLP